ncbi:MAG: LPS-assembly protein LptD [Magnetococcales bacterium]|nr:LPS-assembly protein LptD [Magnetococcales bacterium]
MSNTPATGSSLAAGSHAPATVNRVPGHSSASRVLALCCLFSLFPLPAVAEDELPLDIEADRMDHSSDGQVITATGNVKIMQGKRFEITSDTASYHIIDKKITADGNIRLNREGDIFTSERVELNVDDQRGNIHDVRMDMVGPGGIATAKTVAVHDRNSLTLQEATYTNCDCEEPPWHIRSEEIQVNREENSVTAKNVTLRLGDVPVLYSPWWRQPLRPERKSGFLIPSLRVSGGNGLVAEVPYYWNIAPERDATLAVRGISRRGVMGRLQYRYLGKDYAGFLETYHIQDEQEEEYRGLTVFKHSQRLGAWSLNANINASRSRDFINDFEQDVVDPDAHRLESFVTFDRLELEEDGFTAVQAGVRWNQDLEADSDINTTQQLPFISLTSETMLKSIGENWRVTSDLGFDNFYQMAGDSTQRVDIAPTLRYERPLHFGRISAAAGVRETFYWVNGNPAEAGDEPAREQSREAAMVSLRLDGNLSRNYGSQGGEGGFSKVKHTIEPTVQYVLNSSSDQSRVPDYDATLRNFATTNLFAENRYSGVDRLSTGHWISYGVTSRLIGRFAEDDPVRELATLTVGQRWAPAGHREYQNEEAFSDIVAGLEVDLSEYWSAAAGGRFNHDDGKIPNTDVSLKFHTPRNDWLELGYHRNQPDQISGLEEEGNEDIEDLTLDGALHLSENWLWTQEADYSLMNDNIKSWKSGLRYEHDCWSLDLFGGRSLSSDTDEHGGGFVGFLINLRGLGGYGVNS